MSSPAPERIRSAGNPLVKEVRRLAQDGTAYRRQGRVWLEGDHLCRAALARGVPPLIAVFAESLWGEAGLEWSQLACRVVVVGDALFASISGLDSPGRIGFVLESPAAPPLQPAAASVILDGVQDAGNVGAILRCAAAFGFEQVLAMQGTAGLWSPKVLRAGMGAHFALRLIEGRQAAFVEELKVPLIATSSHRGGWLHQAHLPWPCAWAFGHEGQGLSEEIAGRAELAVRIVQPGGEESLNVAAAAAICLHASAASRHG